jgi:Rrf2 family protein
MRISTKGRYSLEALLFLALLPPGEYANTKTIANNTGVSDGYLEQLFISLRRAGLVQGIRGPQGGYLLGKSSSETWVSDILLAVEGPLSPVDCVNTRVCPEEDRCISRHTWAELYKEIAKCVESISLQNLVDAYHTLDTMDYTL